MDLTDRIMDGPRWIVVTPKGTLGQIGDFLAAMGLGSAGPQAAAMGATIVFALLVLRMAQRGFDRQTIGAADLGPARGVALAAAQARLCGARPGDPAPLPYTPQGGSRGASGSTLIARSGEGCAWRLGLAGSSDRQAMWVCTACRQAAHTRDGQVPKTCHRANPPRPL